jgi:hypothetical protein
MTNEVADLTGRVAELEKTPLPAGPEEVMPTVEIPTEEVDYADEDLDQTSLPADESGVTVELNEELLTPPPTTTEPESLEPIADVLDSSAGTGEEGDESDSGSLLPSYVKVGKPAYIYEETVDLTIEELSILTVDDPCDWVLGVNEAWFDECGDWHFEGPQIEKTGVVVDKYLRIKVKCPNKVNPNSPSQYSGPTVWITESPVAWDKNVMYWVSHSSEVSQEGVTSGPLESPHLKGDPWPLKERAYEIVRSDWPENPGNETVINRVVTETVSVIIDDLDSGEIHYVSLTVGLSHYALFSFNETSEWQCSADLTFVRSYP